MLPSGSPLSAVSQVRRRAGLRRSRARGPIPSRLGGGRSTGPRWRGPFGWNRWQTGAAAAGAALLLFIVVVLVVAVTLPDPSRVDIHLGEVKLLDRTGTRVVADVRGGGELRQEVELKDIASDLRQATVSAEDRHFYENRPLGIDLGRLVKAMTIDLIRRRAAQGASTITQQLAKNELLSGPDGPDRSIVRKFKEAILATEIEQRFDKDTILKLYLNSTYYGHHAYGIEAASRVYFDKPARDLTLSQASLLAGLPQAPSFYDPKTNYDGARDRQRYVLQRMAADGRIANSQAAAAEAEDLRPQLKYRVEAATGPAPHFVEYVLGQLESTYGTEVIQTGGVSVTTTLDLDVQDAANSAVRGGLAKITRYGVNNAAMLVSDPRSGEILAMVGSADFNDVKIAGQVNITTAKRQPGSSFKPYVYLTGINERKFNTLTVFNDSPGVVPGSVHDFDNRFEGRMTLRTALVQSRNVPAEQAMQRAGVDDVIATAHRLGISTRLQPNLATAIGSSEVTMVDHAEGYGVLAQQGLKHEPVAVLKVLASDGRDITVRPANAQRVIDPAPTYIVTDVLKGYNAEWHLGFDRPMAAKSGTSNVGGSTGDGWMMAYNPDIVIATWAGHTDVDPTVGNATRGFFGIYAGQQITAPFLRSFPGRWKDDFTRPGGLTQASCGSPSGLDVSDSSAPAGGEWLLSGDSAAACAAPSAAPSASPNATPSEAPTPTPSPSPPATPLISPLFSPRPSPSASPRL